MPPVDAGNDLWQVWLVLKHCMIIFCILRFLRCMGGSYVMFFLLDLLCASGLNSPTNDCNLGGHNGRA